MTRRLAVLLVLGAALLAAPLRATAQDATPAADAGTELAALDRTNARYFLPFGPDGLNAELTVVEEVTGTCDELSLANVGRPDAWFCVSDDSTIYDPCFENPFSAPDELGQLACASDPFRGEVILLNLSAPLMREKEADAAMPDDGAPPPDQAAADVAAAYGETPGDKGATDRAEGFAGDAVGINPLDIPWALELADGERCTLLTGATAVFAGQRVNYGCDRGDVIGEVDRSQPIWAVSYLPQGGVATTLMPVAVAWT